MDQKKIRAFKDKLVQKKEEILEAYNKNKTYGKEADEDGAQDIADKAANSYTKEFLFSLSNNERDMLQLVDEALLRLNGKRFGVCVVCDGEMERKRLDAVPWAKHCISCQETQEQGLL
jgi:DnaK suppressor protein